MARVRLFATPWTAARLASLSIVYSAYLQYIWSICGCLITEDCIHSFYIQGFPGGSAGKVSSCNVGTLGSIPGLGRSPGEGKGYPLQYSGLENSMDCIVPGVTELDTTEWLSLHFTYTFITFLFSFMTFVSCLSQDLLWTKNSRSRVKRHQKQNLSRKGLCSSPHLWPTAPTGANKPQTVIVTRLLDSWKENLQCVYFHTAKKSNGAFSLGGILWKLEKWSQPRVVFHGASGAKSGQLSGSLPGTWWLMRRSRQGRETPLMLWYPFPLGR